MMKNAHSYLAFDLGASSGKLYCGTFDGRKLIVEKRHQFQNQAIVCGDGLYWDIVRIINEIKSGMQKISAQSDARIISMGIDSFSNDFSLISPAGDMIIPVRCYRDQRTALHADKIKKRISPRELYFSSGNQNALFNTFMQLASMIENKQGYLLEHANKLLFVPDLLLYMLSGEKISEYTISSVSQMYSFEDKTWSQRILDSYGINNDLFAKITPPGQVVGHLTQQVQNELGIAPFALTTVLEHDTASAFWAANAKRNEAIISSGTWSLVGIQTPTYIINEFGYQHNIANEGGYSDHHRLIKNVMGTWLIQQIQIEFARDGANYSFGELIDMARAAEEFRFWIDVDSPELFAPGNMRNKIRNQCNARFNKGPETPGEFVRCICESLACKYRMAIKELEQMSGMNISQVRIVGGGAQDSFTCQLTANACGIPVLAGPTEATAVGNLIVQLIAHGEIEGTAQVRDVLENTNTVVVYEPQEQKHWELMEEHLLISSKKARQEWI